MEKICKKENLNNARKIDYQKRIKLLENLDNSEIKDVLSKETVINIILDNYRVHHAKIVEKSCEILNINLIFLPPYSPDLNPIEDVWREIKDKIYNSNYNSLYGLKKLFKTIFNKIIDKISFYKNWMKKFMNIMI